MTVEERPKQDGVFVRIVFEVGILDDHDIARGARDAAAQRRALAAVRLVQHEVVDAGSELPREALARQGLAAGEAAAAPGSTKRFPAGAHYRIEIPSTEGPRALAAVLDEASKRRVPVHRVSQGSGILLQTNEEICEMATLGREAGIEVNLFIGPRATFDIGAQAFAAAGKTLGLSLRGADQLAYALEDVRRALRLGIYSILVSDLGLLAVMGRMKRSGDLPPGLIIKTSVMMAPCNPASARLLEDLGATTINVPSDLTVPQLAAIRAAIDKKYGSSFPSSTPTPRPVR